MTTIVRVLLGFALLSSGRKLFWLFVGVMGFVVGIALARQYFLLESELVLLAIALIAGVLGAVLAFFTQRLAVAAAGFLAGGYVVTTMSSALEWYFGVPVWLPFVLGGIVGAVLVAVLFDWALIFLSSMAGASLVIQAFDTNRWVSLIIFVVLFGIGVIIQAGSKRQEK